jgi:hypothetical protein
MMKRRELISPARLSTERKARNAMHIFVMPAIAGL